MSSTAACVGIGEDGTKSSSRILKPPGGGHSDIFGPPQENARPQRPKNDQQNSDMMNEIMGKAPAPAAERAAPQRPDAADEQKSFFPSEQKKEPASTRGRVPPGGFSSGLW